MTKTISGHSATPLTALGRDQARELGRYLADSRTQIDVAYSSDLQRASETAVIICEELGIEDIQYDVRLREGNAGLFTGKRVKDLTKNEKMIFERLIVDLDSRSPGGESTNEQFIRTKDAFLDIVKKNSEDSSILLVGHGGTLYHILIRTTQVISQLEEWFGNCKLSIIERESEVAPWRLVMFNNREQ